jgi:prepilin-type N-terminal cleavage/methylation domain-containing protein/prepilin-type processing-associated H-X9-DG protein
MSLNSKRRGFTLVELLVVIAIIGILVGMLFPAIQAVREAARRSSCSNNIRQLALASMNYESAHKKLPPGFTQDRLPKPGGGTDFQGHSVFYFLLPYMEQQNLYDTMNRSMPLANVSSTENGGLAATVVPSFLCPSDLLPSTAVPYPSTGTPSQWYGGTSYRANGGERPYFPGNVNRTTDGVFSTVGTSGITGAIVCRIRDIVDGTSNTIFFGEFYHYDPNFDTFTAGGWNSGSTILGWSRWYPAGGWIGAGNLFGGSIAPINYKTPWEKGAPGAPGSQSAWYDYQDLRLTSYGSGHAGGANFSFGDGSTRFVSDSVSLNILRLWSERADRQVIPNQE